MDHGDRQLKIGKLILRINFVDFISASAEHILETSEHRKPSLNEREFTKNFLHELEPSQRCVCQLAHDLREK